MADTLAKAILGSASRTAKVLIKELGLEAGTSSEAFNVSVENFSAELTKALSSEVERINAPITSRQEGVLRKHGVEFTKGATPKPYFDAEMKAFDHTGCVGKTWTQDGTEVPGCPFSGRPSIAA